MIKIQTHRKAIAMVELIFAIVIMGLVLMSAPMLVSTATKSAETTFQQESIAIAATKISNITTYAWDQVNTQVVNNGLNINLILAVAGGDVELDNRPGLPLIGAKRRAPAAGIDTSASNTFGYGKDFDTNANTSETANNDIDDFNDDNLTVGVPLTSQGNQDALRSDKGDYMDTNVTFKTEVDYMNDAANYNACDSAGGCAFSNPFGAAPANTTNIKQIRVTLTSENVAGKKIVLKAFACNIGSASAPESRTF